MAVKVAPVEYDDSLAAERNRRVLLRRSLVLRVEDLHAEEVWGG